MFNKTIHLFRQNYKYIMIAFNLLIAKDDFVLLNFHLHLEKMCLDNHNLNTQKNSTNESKTLNFLKIRISSPFLSNEENTQTT